MKNEFDRIVGYKEEKKELLSVCNLIKKRDELKKAGGKLPRGLFLAGPNGVGKTVLANCFIKEAKCQSVFVNYNDINDSSDFVPYIKEKFAEAASKAPCVLFIDELDKLIGLNGRYYMEDNFDRSRAILNEINKYSDVEGLFLLIAANQNYSLDYSIVRSGRIDKIIEINLPTEVERYEILKHYASGKKFDKSVNFKLLSELLKDFSGADIECLLNNSLIKVFTENRNAITHNDVMSVYYDKVFKSKQKEGILDEKSQRIIAYHEAGHAAVALLIDPESLNYATILSRNRVKGFVSRRPSETTAKTVKDEKDQIMIALAGLISEEVFLDERTTGSSSDLFVARSCVESLVREHGVCGIENTIFNQEEFRSLDISEEKLKRIERAEDGLLIELYDLSKSLIISNKEMVEFIAEELMSKKILNKKDIDEIRLRFVEEKERSLTAPHLHSVISDISQSDKS